MHYYSTWMHSDRSAEYILLSTCEMTCHIITAHVGDEDNIAQWYHHYGDTIDTGAAVLTWCSYHSGLWWPGYVLPSGWRWEGRTWKHPWSSPTQSESRYPCQTETHTHKTLSLLSLLSLLLLLLMCSVLM